MQFFGIMSELQNGSLGMWSKPQYAIHAVRASIIMSEPRKGSVGMGEWGDGGKAQYAVQACIISCLS